MIQTMDVQLKEIYDVSNISDFSLFDSITKLFVTMNISDNVFKLSYIYGHIEKSV